MLRRVLSCSRLSRPVAAVAAGIVALSCGGGAERPTVVGPATVAIQPTTADDDGSVSAAAKPQTTLLCHYDATTGTWSDLSVPAPAVQPHRNHGDVTGSCAGACPCFPAGHGSLTCPDGLTLGSTCDDPFLLTIGCTAPSGSDPGQLLEFRGVDTTMTCYGQTAQIAFFSVGSLSAAQVAACKQFVVTSPYYLATCPR